MGSRDLWALGKPGHHLKPEEDQKEELEHESEARNIWHLGANCRVRRRQLGLEKSTKPLPVSAMQWCLRKKALVKILEVRQPPHGQTQDHSTGLFFKWLQFGPPDL